MNHELLVYIAGLLIGFILGVVYNVIYLYSNFDIKLKDKNKNEIKD